MCNRIVPLTKCLTTKGTNIERRDYRDVEEAKKMTSRSKIFTLTRLRRNTSSFSLAISESRSSPPEPDIPSEIVINQPRILRRIHEWRRRNEIRRWCKEPTTATKRDSTPVEMSSTTGTKRGVEEKLCWD